jgi:hypothetical protein
LAVIGIGIGRSLAGVPKVDVANRGIGIGGIAVMLVIDLPLVRVL